MKWASPKAKAVRVEIAKLFSLHPELTCADISARTGSSPAEVGGNLRVMADMGLVERQRFGGYKIWRKVSKSGQPVQIRTEDAA